MLTKTEIKYYASLLTKKARISENKFLVEGPKLITEAIESGFDCDLIVFTPLFEKESLSRYSKLFRNARRLECIKSQDFVKLTDTKSPQEVVAFFSNKKSFSEKHNTNYVVALENINDPGNLGSIFRSSDWFGINKIIMNSECAEVFNPKVIRASAGSVFHVSTERVKNFYDHLVEIKNSGYKVMCADLDGENIFERKKEDKIILAFANEANGPSPDLLKITYVKINIPRVGKAESLNVSNACAIILSQITNPAVSKLY